MVAINVGGIRLSLQLRSMVQQRLNGHGNTRARLSRLCEGVVPLAGTTVAIAALVMLARLHGW